MLMQSAMKNSYTRARGSTLTESPLLKGEESMANPSKAKGTGGETELLRLFAEQGFVFVRTSPTTNFDLRHGAGLDGGLDVLAMRPDHGEWLVTLRQADFAELLRNSEAFYEMTCPVNVEVKRHARFALHAIWNKKFGRTNDG